MGVSLFQNQGRVLTPKETLGSLMDTHFLESTELGEDEEVEAVSIGHNDERTMEFVNYITPLKVATSIASFGPLKAAGPDGLKPLVLQKLSYQLLTYMAQLYKMVVKTGYAPKVWRAMKVVFLPKQGKKDYGQAKSYRPITLSNFLLKSLERIMQWFINDHVVTSPLYAQHAYTVNRSCDSAVSEVVDHIECNINRRRHVLAVSLDCSGAFDRIKFTSADEAMKRMQIPPGIRELYGNILKSRTVEAELQGEREIRVPKRGSPQGGVLSPLIWNLIMDTILSQFEGTPVKVVGYADDILLLTTGPDPGEIVESMNEALKKVLEWGDANGLVFNPEKTCVVRFSRSKRFSAWKSVKMNGMTLQFEKSMKYLGVTLDWTLSWRRHAYDRVGKATKTANLANAAIGLKWGFNPERALWVYQAMARSVATYGAIVWSPFITSTTRLKLDQLQRKVLKSMSSAMRSTPTAGMEVILGLMPLDLYTQRMGTSARFRTRDILPKRWDGLGEYAGRLGHHRIHDKILERIAPPGYPIDFISRTRDWIENETPMENPDIHIYTDGSRMENRSGSGWAVCHKDTVIAEESVYLGNESSVFQTEVFAIEQALRWAIENCEKGMDILISSDSQSAISAIFKVTATSKVVQACKEVLRTAKENHRIAIQWVKGHANNTGNELADFLARQASCMNCDTVAPELPVPVSTIAQKLKAHFLAKWQSRWNSMETCRTTRKFYPKVSEGKLRDLSHWKRENLNLLFQTGTGHALVAHHLHKWLDDLEDECELCLEGPESTEHLFFECPALELHRREILGTSRGMEKDLVDFFNYPTIRDLFARRGRCCDERHQERIQGEGVT